MVISNSERKETGTKSVALATPQGVLLGFFPKLQLWCQVSIALIFAEILLIWCFDLKLERLMTL